MEEDSQAKNIEKAVICVNKNSMNRVVIYNLLGKMILTGINFLVGPLFTRLLGADNYALYSLYSTWEAIVTIIVGLQAHSIIGNATMRYGVQERFKLFSCAETIGSFIFIIGIIILTVFGNGISAFIELPLPILYFMLLHSFSAIGVNFLTGIWSFDKDAKRQFVVSLTLAFSNVILSMFLLYAFEKDKLYIGRIVGSAIPSIIFGIWGLLWIAKKGKSFINRKYYRYILTFSVPIVFHGLSNCILGQSDRIMLQKMYNLTDVGIYSVTCTLTNILSIIWSAFNTAWTPFLYEDIKNENQKHLRQTSQNYVWLFTFLVLGFLLVAPEVLVLYGGKEYQSGVYALPFLAIGYYFMFLYSFAVNFKYYIGKTVTIAVGTIASALINIILNFVLIQNMGMYGAALATMLSYIALFLFHHISAKKLGGEKYCFDIKMYGVSAILIGITALLAYTILLNQAIIRWVSAFFVAIILVHSVWKRKSIW